jgi:hypothetical protein
MKKYYFQSKLLGKKVIFLVGLVYSIGWTYSALQNNMNTADNRLLCKMQLNPSTMTFAKCKFIDVLNFSQEVKRGIASEVQ